MSGSRNIYGWTRDDGVVCLSASAASFEGRPYNQYMSREEAEAEVARRNTRGRTNCVLVWED